MAAVVAVETATALNYGASIGQVSSFPMAEGGITAYTMTMTSARTGLAAAMRAAHGRRHSSIRSLVRRRLPSSPGYCREEASVVVGLGSGVGSLSNGQCRRWQEVGGRRVMQVGGEGGLTSSSSSSSPFHARVGDGGSCGSRCRSIGCCGNLVVDAIGRGRSKWGVRGRLVRAAADVELDLAEREGGNAIAGSGGEEEMMGLMSLEEEGEEVNLSAKAVELGASVAAAVEMSQSTTVTMAKKGKNDSRLEERRRQRDRQQMIYQVAAIASSVGFTTLAAAAVWYRFIFQFQGNPIPYNEVLGTFALTVGAVVGMEFWARWAHDSLWHDSLWSMHESHHRPREGPFELNDIFAIINAVPAIGLMSYGFFNKGLIPGLCFGAGLGITLFGMAYMFVHDGLVHKRFPVGPIADLPYLKRVAAAHQLHHADKFDGVPFGLFLGPQELAAVGGLDDLEELLKPRQGKEKRQ